MWHAASQLIIQCCTIKTKPIKYATHSISPLTVKSTHPGDNISNSAAAWLFPFFLYFHCRYFYVSSDFASAKCLTRWFFTFLYLSVTAASLWGQRNKPGLNRSKTLGRSRVILSRDELGVNSATGLRTGSSSSSSLRLWWDSGETAECRSAKVRWHRCFSSQPIAARLQGSKCCCADWFSQHFLANMPLWG